ncbi:MAG: nitroreductase family protein, partial [bacterium]
IDHGGMITFFYRTKEEVDSVYQKLRSIATTEPIENQKYSIYQFFARDPEDRVLEFQCFLHQLPPYLTGTEALITRRSIRIFEDEPVPDELLWQIFEHCRYAPTSKNSQSYYFVVIRDRNKLEFLASLRGNSSAPIARAPLAIAICSDSSKTLRPEQDGCIAAYHFLLAAWNHGLGTCWIAAMDREEVKSMLNISRDHYIATVTPLGFPVIIPSIPERRSSSEIVRFID